MKKIFVKVVLTLIAAVISIPSLTAHASVVKTEKNNGSTSPTFEYYETEIQRISKIHSVSVVRQEGLIEAARTMVSQEDQSLSSQGDFQTQG